MPTPVERSFQTLFASARRQTVRGPGGVHEQRLALDGPLLHARSRLVTSGPFLFVRGENEATEELQLRHDGHAPAVILHAPLRGNAWASLDGLEAPMASEPGEVQLCVAPTSGTTVRLRAAARNEAFRISIEPSALAGLAARHPPLERLATGHPFSLPPAPLPRLEAEVAEIMDSDHYGIGRALFLEARALGWLARALSPTTPPPRPEIVRREVERMHEARALLLARLGNPPTLAEVAAAVGTNDFALKRHFKAVFGQPVHGYLLAARLAHACALLRETGATIKEIATAVGYAHAGHFSTAFRRVYGLPPGRFRARSRS